MRLNRLKADYEAVRRLAHLHPRIEVEGVEGNPPERYILKFKVRSLREQGEKVMLATEHRVELTLPLAYPRNPPVSRMLTPVFHPNIAPHAICIGDDWSAGESLDNLIQRIGEMLSFQSYNVKSPLNGRAARWVEENERRLPVDKEEFFIDLAAEPERRESAASPAAAERCSNCDSGRGAMETCPVGHVLCRDCVETCPKCARVLCIVCGTLSCPACDDPPCSNCGSTRPASLVCTVGHSLCYDCVVECDACQLPLCMLCGEIQSHRCRRPAAPPPLP